MKHLLLLFLLSSTFCFSQKKNFTQLDALFDLLDSKQKVMGSLAIMEDGEFVYKNSIGYQYLEEKKKANENSKYRIGSITKVFTATMIFQLVDEHKISLDDKLAKYFPGVPNATNISISNLINHSSGLFNITEDPEFNKWMLKPSTQDDMISRIKTHDVLFQPGEKAAYSNTNYIILGYILEKIEGEPYSELLKNRIVNKLKLKSTYYGGIIDTKNKECKSYYYGNGKLNPAKETDMSNPAGAGSIVSTPSDLTIFIHALFNDKLMSSSSFEYMTTLSRGSHCNGIMTLQRDGQTIFGHGGGIDGFHAFLVYAPKIKTAIAVTLNATKYGVQPIVFHALDEASGKTFKMPNFDRIELTEEQVKRYEGVYESKELPFDLTFVAHGNILKAGPNPKQLSNLAAINKDEFTLEAMGVILKFDLEKGTLLFDDQTGSPKLLTKKQ